MDVLKHLYGKVNDKIIIELKKLPTLGINLVLIGNYIEKIKAIKPVSYLDYTFHYKYFFDENISPLTVLDILQTYNKIWIPSRKREGYFFIKRDFYLPEDTVSDILSRLKPLGGEELFKIRTIIQGLGYNELSAFLLIVKDPELFQKLSRRKEFRDYLNILRNLGLVEKNSFTITKKGWKTFYLIKDLFTMFGKKDILRFFGF